MPRLGPSSETMAKYDAIVKAVEGGMTVTQACSENGMDNKNFYRFIKRYQLKKPEPKLEFERAKGQLHGRSVLTEEKVLVIKQLIRDGFSNAEIANRFGVSRALISHIKNGRIWRHLSGAEGNAA